MKLRVADRVAGQFFNALYALMQRVAMETQPVGGPHHVAVLLQQRLEGLQQQPRRFTARLDQAAEVSCIKSLSSAGSLTADSSLINPSC